MGAHKMPYERKQIVEDYYKSGLSICKFAALNNIAKSTLHDWLRLYSCEKLDLAKENNDQPFYDITNEVTNLPTIEPKTNTIISSTPSLIKLSTNKFTLEFDVNLLKDVIEVFK